MPATGAPAQFVTVTVKFAWLRSGFTTSPFADVEAALTISQLGVTSFCTNRMIEALWVSPTIVFCTAVFALITSVRCWSGYFVIDGGVWVNATFPVASVTTEHGATVPNTKA